jgi:hypothetical protein
MNPNWIDSKFTLATYPYHATKVVRHSQNLSMNILKFRCILIKYWAHNFHLLIHLNSPHVHYYSFVQNNPHEFKFLKNFVVHPNKWPFDVKRGLYIHRPINKNGSSWVFSILIPTKVSNHLLHKCMVGRTCHHFPPLYCWQLHNEFVLWCIKFSKPYVRFKI